MAKAKQKFAHMPLVVHGLFCETIREEKTGSSSYVGVFPDNMDVPFFPGAIPFLSAVLWVSWPVTAPAPQSIMMSLELPGTPNSAPTPLAIPTIAPPAIGMRRHVISTKLQMGTVLILTAGRIRIILDIDGKSYLGAALNIRQLAPAPAG